jgi:hypothetical protein
MKAILPGVLLCAALSANLYAAEDINNCVDVENWKTEAGYTEFGARTKCSNDSMYVLVTFESGFIGFSKITNWIKVLSGEKGAGEFSYANAPYCYDTITGKSFTFEAGQAHYLSCKSQSK